MVGDVVLDRAPDLRRIFVAAPFATGRNGEHLPDVRVVRRDVGLDVDSVARYASLCGFPLGSRVPASYPHMVISPLQMVLMSRSDFPLPMMGLVHLVNEIHQVRPLSIGEPVTATVTAEGLRPHAKGRQVDLVARIDVRDETVWSSRSTYLSRGRGGDGQAPAATPPDVDDLAARSAGTLWRLGGQTGRRYAAVSGDWNPIHLHSLTARPLGFPTAIAHGMYTYARAMADVDARTGDEGLTSTVWFLKPVRLPSTVLQRSRIDPGRTRTLLSNRSGDIRHAVIENRW